MDNNLPEIVDLEKDVAKTYQNVGATIMLDIVQNNEIANKDISSYYDLLLSKIAAQQITICRNNANQPAGYAHWQENEDKQISIEHICAPFGDHLILLTRLKNNLKNYTNVVSVHPNSSREVQVAW